MTSLPWFIVNSEKISHFILVFPFMTFEQVGAGWDKTSCKSSAQWNPQFFSAWWTKQFPIGAPIDSFVDNAKDDRADFSVSKVEAFVKWTSQ